MSLDRDRFERLVRWYPRWWRDANAAVFVGTAMDAAEAGGLSAPSRGERMAAALAGLGTRLDATTAPEALRASHVRSGTAKTDADATAPSDVPIEVAKTDAEAPPARVCCQRPRRCRKAAWC